MTDDQKLQVLRLRRQRLTEMSADEHQQRLLYRRLSGLTDEQQWDRVLELHHDNYTVDQTWRVLLKLPLPADLDARGWPIPGITPMPDDMDEYNRKEWLALERDINQAAFANVINESPNGSTGTPEQLLAEAIAELDQLIAEAEASSHDD